MYYCTWNSACPQPPQVLCVTGVSVSSLLIPGNLVKGSPGPQTSNAKSGTVPGKPGESVTLVSREMNSNPHRTRVQKTLAFRALGNMPLSTWCRSPWFCGVRNSGVSHPGKTASQGPWLAKGGQERLSAGPLSKGQRRGWSPSRVSSCSLWGLAGVPARTSHLPARVSPHKSRCLLEGQAALPPLLLNPCGKKLCHRRGHHLQASPLEISKHSHLTKN